MKLHVPPIFVVFSLVFVVFVVFGVLVSSVTFWRNQGILERDGHPFFVVF